ncbi:MAG: hypothetical protein ACRENE_13560, partial [Polyangiaceae bacterium]
RETSSRYLRAAGVAVRPPRKWGHAKAAKGVITDPGADADSNPAKEPIPDPGSPTWRPPARSPAASACEPYREIIEDGLGRGRNAKAIWQDHTFWLGRSWSLGVDLAVRGIAPQIDLTDSSGADSGYRMTPVMVGSEW